jgi:hypothetical protein
MQPDGPASSPRAAQEAKNLRVPHRRCRHFPLDERRYVDGAQRGEKGVQVRLVARRHVGHSTTVAT